MQPILLDAAAYRRIWNYQAQDGTALVLISQGPDIGAGSYALCETEKAYLLAELWGNSPRSLEQSAEKIEWAKIITTGGIKQ